MTTLSKTITAQVFSTSTLQGSPQSLTFVDDISLLHTIPGKLLPGIDYTVAYYHSDHRVSAIWRNHFNTIELCGSAAFALSHYLLHAYELPYLEIQTPNLTLQAKYNSQVSLFIPAKKIEPIASQLFGSSQLLHHGASGIYFIELADKQDLLTITWTEEDIVALPLDNAHGLALFYWHSATHTGYVRYFNPWHGRFEDTVTGSIQSYLTTYVAELYGIASQTWIQLSQNGGQINTMFMQDVVRLQGNCSINAD